MLLKKTILSAVTLSFLCGGLNAEILSRDEVPQEKTWNLTSFYPSKDKWEDHLARLSEEAKFGFEKLKPFAFENMKGIEIKALLDSFFSYQRELENLFVYAHLNNDVDLGNSEYKQDFGKALGLYQNFESAVSWLVPELLKLDDHEFLNLLADEDLSEYKFYLTKLKDQKEHILEGDKERILALALPMQNAASSAFRSLSNVDLTFGELLDSEGNLHFMSNARYGICMKSKDRVLRKNAFNLLHSAYLNFGNTFSELLQGNVQNHLFNAKARSYDSCLEAALSPKNIPTSVYHNLVDAVSENLDSLHRFTALKKKVLGVDKLYAYDLYMPLVEKDAKKYTFEEACDIVLASVAPLGEKYVEVLRKGLTHDRWVDVLENKGKRGGAYSSGSYDSNPYILLNFQGTLYDVLILAHEAGHSMNSYLSNQKQSYQDAGYTIFVAEVASTFNEQLTYEYLLNKAESSKERMYIINAQLDAIRGTLFRQTLFAEFELKIHEVVESGGSLSLDTMKDIYGGLSKKYYGEALEITDEHCGEFLRVPHFHYNFYVYQYATGISAAIALVEQVKAGGLDAYLDFLAAGGSDYSIELLKRAGVDMTSKEPVEKTLKVFNSLVEKLEKEFEK